MRPVTADLAIALDRGSAWTKASVIGRAAGRWRLSAFASQPTDWGDEELLASLGRRLAPLASPGLAAALPALLADAPLIECHTPRRPGRLALVAVSRELSALSARRAAEAAGWVVVEAATIDDGRPLAERLAALQSAAVDGWLLAGGFDGSTGEQAVEMAALAAAARGRGRGPVLWAGSAQLGDVVSGLFEPGAVTTVPNARPSPGVEEPMPLRRALEDLLRATIEPEGPTHLAPHSFRRAVGELARGAGITILGVDVGARYATWVLARDGETESRVIAEGGVASPALVAAGVPRRVARGLPRLVDELIVADALQNMHSRPATLPQAPEELIVLHGAVRHQLHEIAAAHGAAAGIDLVVGAGRPIAGAQPGHAVELLLEGVRPLGVTQLATDPAALLTALGSLSDEELPEGLGSLRDDLLAPLGAAVVTRGGRPGAVALRMTVTRDGEAPSGPHEFRHGQLGVLPLRRRQAAELDIELESGVSLGAPRRSRRARARVTGGSVGIVVDTRDIPIAMPRRIEDRRTVAGGWHDTLAREPALRAESDEPAR